MELDCIYLAAGIGRRMGKKIPKQLIRIGGKPIMVYSLETLVKSNLFSRIIITYPEGYMEEYKKIISHYFVRDFFELVRGGETRQESVYNALQKVETDRVVIHEAARPFVTQNLLNRVISYEEDCVTPVINVKETVAAGYDYMNKIFKRDELKIIQLPQFFNTKILRNAHEMAYQKKLLFTDDSTLVHYFGYKVKFIEGEETNIKITTANDLLLAERILFSRELPSE